MYPYCGRLILWSKHNHKQQSAELVPQITFTVNYSDVDLEKYSKYILNKSNDEQEGLGIMGITRKHQVEQTPGQCKNTRALGRTGRYGKAKRGMEPPIHCGNMKQQASIKALSSEDTRHSEQQVDVKTSIGESTKRPVGVETSGSWNSKYIT